MIISDSFVVGIVCRWIDDRQRPPNFRSKSEAASTDRDQFPANPKNRYGDVFGFGVGDLRTLQPNRDEFDKIDFLRVGRSLTDLLSISPNKIKLVIENCKNNAI